MQYPTFTPADLAKIAAIAADLAEIAAIAADLVALAADLAEIAAIAADLAALAADNPNAMLPDSPEQVFLAERMGLLWDFDEGRWLPDGGDRGIAYVPTPAGLALVAQWQAEEA